MNNTSRQLPPTAEHAIGVGADMLDSQSGRPGAKGLENLPRSGRGKRKAGIRDKEIPLDALPKVSSSGQPLTPTPTDPLLLHGRTLVYRLELVGSNLFMAKAVVMIV
eukprot:scaffold406960_cov26-Prasinocladus_malaysianus.AAC.1